MSWETNRWIKKHPNELRNHGSNTWKKELTNKQMNKEATKEPINKWIKKQLMNQKSNKWIKERTNKPGNKQINQEPNK